MRFLSNFGCKIIFMCSVNFWHQQDSNSLFKGSIGHVTSECKWPIAFEYHQPLITTNSCASPTLQPSSHPSPQSIPEIIALKVCAHSSFTLVVANTAIYFVERE